MLGNISSLAHDAAITPRLCQVLVASPQNVAKFVVCKSLALITLQTDGMKHIQEHTLDGLPPSTLHGTLKVGALRKPGKIFLCSSAEVPEVLLGKIHDFPADTFLGILKHVVQEIIEVCTEELTQAVMGYSLMQHSLLNIFNVTMILNHDGNLASMSVIETLRLLALTGQR